MIIRIPQEPSKIGMYYDWLLRNKIEYYWLTKRETTTPTSVVFYHNEDALAFKLKFGL